MSPPKDPLQLLRSDSLSAGSPHPPRVMGTGCTGVNGEALLPIQAAEHRGAEVVQRMLCRFACTTHLVWARNYIRHWLVHVQGHGTQRNRILYCKCC